MPIRNESIYIRVSRVEKREILPAFPEGEMSDTIRAMLLMYARDDNFREKVRLYKELQVSNNGWQQP